MPARKRGGKPPKRGPMTDGRHEHVWEVMTAEATHHLRKCRECNAIECEHPLHGWMYVEAYDSAANEHVHDWAESPNLNEEAARTRMCRYLTCGASEVEDPLQGWVSHTQQERNCDHVWDISRIMPGSPREGFVQFRFCKHC